MQGVFLRVVSGDPITRQSKAGKPYRKQSALLCLPSGAQYPTELFVQDGHASLVTGDYELAAESIKLGSNGRFELDPRAGAKIVRKSA